MFYVLVLIIVNLKASCIFCVLSTHSLRGGYFFFNFNISIISLYQISECYILLKWLSWVQYIYIFHSLGSFPRILEIIWAFRVHWLLLYILRVINFLLLRLLRYEVWLEWTLSHFLFDVFFSGFIFRLLPLWGLLK